MILITGHKGFIGSHLTKMLDSLSLDWIGFDLKEGHDIRNKLQLESIFDSNPIDTVIHMAALAGARRGDEYPQEYFDTNVIGSENVGRLCEKYGVKKLIAFSSASSRSCQNTYGVTKLTMELMLSKIKIPSVFIVRPFNIYGENGRADQVIWKWKARAEAGLPIEYHGNLKRNYTYVGDFIKGIKKLLDEDVEGYHVFDFADKNKVGLEELLNVFKEKYHNLKVVQDIKKDIEVTPDMHLVDSTDFISKVKELIK